MNPLNKILIQVQASDPPKSDGWYLTDKGYIQFRDNIWEVFAPNCIVTYYFRPASSIEEIKEMLGQQLFTKEEMNNHGREMYNKGYALGHEHGIKHTAE